jgi:hypothetical protein
MITKEKTRTHRKSAITVGVLFIIGTVAGVLSGILTEPILGDPDYLIKIAANENQIIIGSLLVLVMGFAVAMIPVVMFPILRKYNEGVALGSVLFRGAFEGVCYIALVISMLLLLTLSQEYVKAGAPDASYFQTLGTLLQAASVGFNQILAIVFCLGALMLYYLFYISRLIPRWLSVWGLVGATLYLAAPVISMVGPQHWAVSLTSPLGILIAPLAIQEMVFAVWVIVKGFNSPAIVAPSAK